MKRDLSWLILVLSYACSLVYIGVYAKSKEFDIKRVTISEKKKDSETKRTGIQLKRASRSLDFGKVGNQGAKSPPLGNTTLEKRNKSESGKTTEPSLHKVINSSSTNKSVKPDIQRILRGHKGDVILIQTIDEHKVNKKNEAMRRLEAKPRIAKSSKSQNKSEQTSKKRAKKLLVSFFEIESNDTELHAERSHENKTRKPEKTNNATIRNEHATVHLNTRKNAISAVKESQLMNKRTRLPHTGILMARQGLVTSPKQSNQVSTETMLSSADAERRQHVRVSSQPTHIRFKPVHKYYPAIHRYMTHPIHRFLKKPVNLPGLAAQLSRPQQLQGGVVQGQQAPTIQVARPQHILSGRLVTAPHPVVQDSRGQAGPVRMFGPMPARIQPVLIDQHRLSSTGYGPCTTNPCKNSGVCSSVNEQALCICRAGFRGKFCELINNCHPNPCHNFGSCTELNRDFECSCRKGYRGKRCEVENKCEPNPCVNGGTCSEMEEDYVCSCREGFLGHSCEAESKCNPINPCKNGGSCQEARETYKCLCRDGFGGYNCEARVIRDHCQPNPCHHEGFCTLTGTSTGNFTCSCSPGWKGFTCVEKVDNWGNTAGPSICESVNPCMFGGTCTPGSYYDYTCTCPSGRDGVHCEHSLVQEKPTASCSHCDAFARCHNNHCQCNEGYKGDGLHCVPASQFCHPNPCYNGGTCLESSPKHEHTSSSGGKQWWCECPAGYSGSNCQEMDLCHMHLCQNGGSCTNDQGQASCQCRTAYHGKYCEEKDVCHSNPCNNGGSCKPVNGVATCLCPDEYEGTLCGHWKCSLCDPRASCSKGTCICNHGYSGDGRTCRKNIPRIPLAVAVAPAPVSAPVSAPKLPVTTFCDSNPCASGATCLEALQTYFCQCPEDKYGKQCEQTPKVIADLCSKCDIDASCRDGKCVCNEGFTGSGFNCRKSQVIHEEPMASNLHRSDSSCDFCPENGQCLGNVCVCPPGFANRKRSCVAIDDSGIKYNTRPMSPGMANVGMTRNKLPIGQWKENSVVDEYRSLGCWADTKDWRNPMMRAMEVMEGLHPSLNDDYKKRENPITKCADAAKVYDYKIFAIQNGGQCFSGSDAEKSFSTYGPSTLCRFGAGGTLSNDVYKLS